MDRSIAIAQKQAAAISLRAAGANYDDIARELGYANRSGAYKAVKKGLRDTVAKPAEELRQLESDRLNDLMQVVYPIATDPDHKDHLRAVHQMLQIIDSQAKLWGLW